VLRRSGAVRTFSGDALREIAMPIGGIGAGCISLGGWGQLRDWEIYNRPGKGNVNNFAFFSLYAKPRGARAVTKVLLGPTRARYDRDGFGYYRESGQGLPHFTDCSFSAMYPFAWIDLADATMPLRARLTAWNPFIPLNDHDSSLPCAIFQWTLTNTARQTVDAVLFMNLTNTIAPEQHIARLNSYRDTGSVRGIYCTARGIAAASPHAGSMALATPHADTHHLVRWLRSGWFDPCTDFWSQAERGMLDTSVRAQTRTGPHGDTSSIAMRCTLAPGAATTIPVIISWLMPNAEFIERGRSVVVKTYQGAQWSNAWRVADYVAHNFTRLERETRMYADTLAASTLPGPVIDAVAATSAVLKSPTCTRMANGDFWAWEGCGNTVGCCPGTCTHVWNYQQMMPYLFPALERTIRSADFTYNLGRSGALNFRLPLPIGTRPRDPIFACADGQFGAVLKVYRDWRISGDTDWLRRLWPKVRKAIDYTFTRWDLDRDGIMEGVQHNTYDINFWGPNTMCGSFYLAALRAGEEMARRCGDERRARRYRALFERGRAWSDANLFNGEYYEQRINRDAWKLGLSTAQRKDAWWCGPVVDGHPKYQYGTGCLADQLLGQLFADMLELGDLYDPEHMRSASASIFAHNFRTSFFEHANPQRVFALDHEAGLVLCSWPRGEKERFPFPYSEEVWTGIEYATAALLAYRGHVSAALAVVKAARDRHDGVHRNPFDEVECGHHYARAMASYAVLLALSGFAADLPHKRLRFAPVVQPRDFAVFFAVDTGWGLYTQQLRKRSSTHLLDVRYGVVTLQRLALGGITARSARATVGRTATRATVNRVEHGLEIVFDRPVAVKPGQPLRVTLT
jgi:uncharacterized protein (DUF608 family)